MEGKNRWQDKDAKGKLLIQEIVKAARQGTASPNTGPPSPPSVGMRQALLQPGARQVPVGHRHRFYIDDIDNELAVLRTERESNMRDSLQSSVLLILVILG